ncbi:hypothetical protein AKJ61_04165 [candidate division MSBL1 archaeon SCGC-AAA259B11]|uniref:Uncharacterized protein n=1 Tax=candidate division MSBL1 archaeon SCGC-AAA259B11 TaxID=1698260 RepID=A0A133U3P5_9EURY|nr:hypothetical protein AKJ61_04165 [candidate division MSBL1 archaeon SCGC-AAA259B11]
MIGQHGRGFQFIGQQYGKEGRGRKRMMSVDNIKASIPKEFPQMRRVRGENGTLGQQREADTLNPLLARSFQRRVNIAKETPVQIPREIRQNSKMPHTSRRYQYWENCSITQKIC